MNVFYMISLFVSQPTVQMEGRREVGRVVLVGWPAVHDEELRVDQFTAHNLLKMKGFLPVLYFNFFYCMNISKANIFL